MYSKNDILNKIVKNNSQLCWLNDKTHYITIHGSRAYNTNIETSDYDFKGFSSAPKEYYFGSQSRFEQAELKEPDTVIYELRKFFTLAANSNPNILETLFTDPSDHLYVDDIGKIVLDNKEKFLSKRIKHSMLGYAVSQLKRIKLHRKHLLNPPKKLPTREDFNLPPETLIPQDQLMAVEAEIKKELEKLQFDFMEELNEPTKIAIRSAMTEMLAKLKVSTDDQYLGAARSIGLNENFIRLLQLERAYKNAKSEWDHYQEWKRNRNPERAAMEASFGFDGKHALQLMRLTRTAREVLTTGKFFVKRPDREELLAIRRGEWSYEKLIEEAEKEEKAVQEIYLTSNILPKIPDMNYLDNLCIQLIEKSLNKYSWFNVKKYIQKLFDEANLPEMHKNSCNK